MASNPTIVLAKLDSNELMKSIDDLVNSVGDKTQKMATQFEKSINIMNDAMKNFAVTQKVSVDTMKEAWREMSASFDAMVKAQSGAKGGGSGSGRGKGGTPQTYADNTVGALEQSIKLHQREQKELVLNTEELRKQNNLIEQQKNLLQSQKRGRMSMKEVLGMDESSLDAIRQKLSALRKVTINPQNAKQVKLLGDEYARLSIKQKEMMGMNSILYNSNNALARSFNYIRNRIIYAFTVTAVAGFVKELYRVRGEYEMLERSLGVLTNDMRRGSEIFQELNQMALKSPFTLVELGTAAKQLTAYNFAADEVVDTTRRLADISAALGVPMERLVYNLGQIKAQGALTARDARDFANAGLAIVPMLADMYTKQKKFGDELVTTAQVYDMMSKKMVTYSDVMKVINGITDEGGKFFDYQAKQADTLRVQLANLSLAYNNMLNEIGSEQQEVIEMPIKTLRYLYENWRQVAGIVKTVAMAYGIYKAAQLSILALHFAQKVLFSAEAMYKLGVSVRGVITNLKMLGIIIKSNPMGLLASVLAGVAGYFMMLENSMDEATEYTERFGKAGGKVVRETETLFDTIGNITKGTSNYKKVLGELNSILDEYGIAQVKESDNIDQINAKRAVAIDLIKQEALERKHLNDIQQGEDTYNKATDEAKKNLHDSLKDAYTGGLIMTQNEELAKNADAISNIISDAVTQNISLIANKTGKEYENGMKRIFSIIQDRMRAIGLSEKTIQDDWVKGMFFGQKNIVLEYVKAIQDAKEAQDAYTEAMNKAFEAEMREAQAHTTVRDKIAATNRVLYNARTDSEKFYNAIDKIIKDFSGQNILDFLVRVKTDVPKWMMNMSLDDLSRLAARFAALAQNATGSLNVNGKMMTKEQLAIRAAQYAQAYKSKQEEEGTNITKAASEALRKYKEALDAVRVAQNLVAQGEKDEAFLKRKQTEEQNAYNKALKAGVSAQELYEAKYGKGKGGSGSKKDEFAETVKKEIQIVDEATRKLKEYYKLANVTPANAQMKMRDEYGRTLNTLDTQLGKYGLYGLGAADIAKQNLPALKEYYTKLLELAKTKNSVQAIEALEKAIANLGVEMDKVSEERFLSGLKSKLESIKDEYELGVEIDANPEFGNAFLESFGFDTSTLPRNMKQYAEKVTDALNEALATSKSKFRLPSLFDLTDKGFKEYEKAAQSGSISKEVWDEIVKNYNDIKNKRQQDFLDTLKKAQSLQYELADIDGKIAIKEKELQLTRQKLAGETDKVMREYLELQIQEQERAINKLKEEVVQLLPTYRRVFSGIAEHSKMVAQRLARDWEDALKNAQKNEDGTYTITDPINGKKATVSAKQYGKELDKISEKLRESQTDVQKMVEGFTKGADGIYDMGSGMSYLSGLLKGAASTVGSLKDMLTALYGEMNTEGMDVLQGFLDGMSSMSSGISSMMNGDVFGAATGIMNGITAIANAISNSENSLIDKQIKRSETELSNLEFRYKELAHVMRNAYGLGELEAQKQLEANKKLQLAELERQLRLEQSRSEKNQDEEKIQSLRSEIQDLQQEIDTASESIINDLLSISSVGDAAENLVSAMIEAFKKGEDYMKEYDDAFADMIDSLITKSIAGNIVGKTIQEVWDAAEKAAEQRVGKVTQEDVDRATANYNRAVKNLEAYDTREEQRELAAKGGRTRKDLVDAVNEAKAALEMAQQGISQEILVTAKDIKSISGIAAAKRDEAEKRFKELMDAYGITFGQDAEGAQLSNLRQGISQISEPTANAIEAYLNGVSQQVYLHSTLLTQIRDVMVTFDPEVSMGIQSQMLLQLQTQYQLMESMHSLMSSWTNPAGNGIRVEML